MKGDDKGSGGKQMITDSRFSSAHTDPKFRTLPRRHNKVTIDSRFKGVLTDKPSAPVDKRGKRRRRGSAKDSLRDYYRIELDDKKKKLKEKRKDDSQDDSVADDSEAEQEQLIALKAESSLRKSELSTDQDSEEDSLSDKKFASYSDEESDESAESQEEDSEEEDTDEDDEAISDDDGPEIAEENIASIDKETHRLAIVSMDWRYVSAKDLYVVLNSFLPKDGRLLSVSVYPTEFGLERMKHEEIHGPAIGGDKLNEDNSDDEEEEEEDEDVTNERLRDYEKSRLKYYFAVAVCDSSATADCLYKSCDGIEFERSSNKLDLRFIPDSMEFKHPARDIATEAPANYQGLDFQSQALQLSKVNVTWDEDEPHRVKTLNQKFNPDQLVDLELKEYLASDESESDEENKKEQYLALIESGDADSDKDEDEKNDQDMEFKYNTVLEDLSKKIIEKKDKKSETVWEEHLREKREKKRARRMQQKDDSSSPDDNDDDDDYYVDDHKKKKKKKKGLEEKVAADERSIAELELIVADENGGDGKGLKGYNIKGKGKKRSKDMQEEKIPSADPDDQRFAAAFTDPDYALDPTNPQFKRSATYVKQIAQKQKEDPRSQEQVKATETVASTTDGMVVSKKRSFTESATVKSVKLKMQQKGLEKKKEGTAELAQRVKKKAKALSKN